jgi:hypothetical protein
MKKAEKVLTYILILFAGIAVGIMTPQSWYPRGAGLRTTTSVRAMLQR